MQKKISILGCGWLGLPLAEALIEKNHSVSGSSTTPAKLEVLAQKKIKSFLINLSEPETLNQQAVCFQADILIIAIPPRRNSGNSYAAQIQNLKQFLEANPYPGRKLIFISSTSVYKPSLHEITEESDLDVENSSELIQAENSILSLKKQQPATIIRFAGLFGPNREPGRFLAGKTNLPDPEAPVNLIHSEDCIGIIIAIIQQEKYNEIYNGCADEHPTRKEFYTAAAQSLNLPKPEFFAQNSTGLPIKLISNSKLKLELNYSFIYPDPLAVLQGKTVSGPTKNTN